ncbi:MAG: DUF3298 domain-containing protein [Campylobacterales bacterium]|nr:DUF3298 domain-containing protein [Campylobacterales bacterium]
MRKNNLHILIVLTALFLLTATLQAQSIIESEDLLKTLAYDDDNDSGVKIYEWEIKEGNTPMVNWDAGAVNFSEKGFERKGELFLGNHGKITHHTVGDEVENGKWELFLLGNKERIIRAELKPNAITQEKPSIEINKIYIQEQISCKDTPESKVLFYSIKMAKKKPFWLEENTTISSKGSASSYIITYDQKPVCTYTPPAETKQQPSTAEATNVLAKTGNDSTTYLIDKQEFIIQIKEDKQHLCKKNPKTSKDVCYDFTIHYPLIIQSKNDHVKELVTEAIKIFVAEAKKNSYESYLTMDTEMSSGYYDDVNIELFSTTASTYTLRLGYAGYSGGAHDYMGFSFYNFDRQDGHPVTIEDLFGKDINATLIPVAEQALRKTYNLYPAERLSEKLDWFEDAFVLAKQYALVPNGIYFAYTPYEVAPWAVSAGEDHDFVVSLDALRYGLSTPGNSASADKTILSYSNIKSFIESLLQSGCYRNEQEVSLYYSQNVKRFFSFTNPSHKMIYEDNVKYCKRWTQINYTLDSLQVIEQYTKNSKAYADISIDIGFYVVNNSKHITGTSKQFITLVVENNEIKIESAVAQSTKSTSAAKNTTGDYLKNYAYELMTGRNMSNQNDIIVKYNSKGIKIYCLSNMKMCKTEAEVRNYFERR